MVLLLLYSACIALYVCLEWILCHICIWIFWQNIHNPCSFVRLFANFFHCSPLRSSSSEVYDTDGFFYFVDLHFEFVAKLTNLNDILLFLCALEIWQHKKIYRFTFVCIQFSTTILHRIKKIHFNMRSFVYLLMFTFRHSTQY